MGIETFGVGQAIGMSVIVQNGNPRGVPTVEAPDALRVTYTGQSTTTSIVNGQVESYVKFRFEIAAQEEGSYTVGPAKVQVVDRRGKTYAIETGRASFISDLNAIARDLDRQKRLDGSRSVPSAVAKDAASKSSAISSRTSLVAGIPALRPALSRPRAGTCARGSRSRSLRRLRVRESG